MLYKELTLFTETKMVCGVKTKPKLARIGSTRSDPSHCKGMPYPFDENMYAQQVELVSSTSKYDSFERAACVRVAMHNTQGMEISDSSDQAV